MAIVAASTLLLTACGGGAGDLDGVEVTKGDAPKVTVDKDFTSKETTTKVVKEGGGEEIKEGDTAKINYIAVNGRTGKEFDNSFSSDRPMSLTLNESTALPGFQKGLVGQKVGSRLLVAVSSEDGASLLQSADSLGLKKTDTMVFLFDIIAKVPAEASGTAQKLPSDVPAITYDKDKHPNGFKKSKKTAKKLDKTDSFVVIKGTGEKIKKGQTLTAQYVGQHFPAGEVFDESWTSGPRQFAIGTGAVIPCWDSQLVGKTLGSRVVVECTADDAYGDSAKSKGMPEGPLIFVVDLLDAA